MSTIKRIRPDGSPAQLPPKKRRSWLIYALAGVFIFFCICPMIVGLFRATGQRAGLLATSAPRPSVTPPPTALPQVTMTPTATPAPKLSEAAQEYFFQVGLEWAIMKEAMDNFTALNASPLVADSAWRVDVKLEAGRIRDSHKQLSEMIPPAEFSEFHAAMTEATAACDKSMEMYATALDNNDPAGIRTSTTWLEVCTLKLRKPAGMLEDLTAN